jgi:hypothetical protein
VGRLAHTQHGPAGVLDHLRGDAAEEEAAPAIVRLVCSFRHHLSIGSGLSGCDCNRSNANCARRR